LLLSLQKLLFPIIYMYFIRYEKANDMFANISKSDPSCAMALWGQANALWTPLWFQPSNASLTKGKALLDQARSLNATEREKVCVKSEEKERRW